MVQEKCKKAWKLICVFELNNIGLKLLECLYLGYGVTFLQFLENLKDI